MNKLLTLAFLLPLCILNIDATEITDAYLKEKLELPFHDRASAEENLKSVISKISNLATFSEGKGRGDFVRNLKNYCDIQKESYFGEAVKHANNLRQLAEYVNDQDLALELTSLIAKAREMYEIEGETFNLNEFASERRLNETQFLDFKKNQISRLKEIGNILENKLRSPVSNSNNITMSNLDDIPMPNIDSSIYTSPYNPPLEPAKNPLDETEKNIDTPRRSPSFVNKSYDFSPKISPSDTNTIPLVEGFSQDIGNESFIPAPSTIPEPVTSDDIGVIPYKPEPSIFLEDESTTLPAIDMPPLNETELEPEVEKDFTVGDLTDTIGLDTDKVDSVPPIDTLSLDVPPLNETELEPKVEEDFKVGGLTDDINLDMDKVAPDASTIDLATDTSGTPKFENIVEKSTRGSEEI
jgi:hypothetical protein